MASKTICGDTVTVNVWGVPKQVTELNVYCGVTVIVAVTLDVPLLDTVTELIFPDPLAARPMDGVSFVQM
jgi:hypothetical protein